MKYQSLYKALGLSIFAFIFTLSPGFSQSILGFNNQKQVNFFCHDFFDRASGEKIPTTVAWVPERQGHVRFISWKSEYFAKSGWTPQKRCQEVSRKFQNFFDSGKLNYLTAGTNNGLSVICAVQINEKCNGENQLFTLKTGNDNQLVLVQLMNILEGKSSEPLGQSSGNKIDVHSFLKNAPLINLEK